MNNVEKNEDLFFTFVNFCPKQLYLDVRQNFKAQKKKYTKQWLSNVSWNLLEQKDLAEFSIAYAKGI